MQTILKSSLIFIWRWIAKLKYAARREVLTVRDERFIPDHVGELSKAPALAWLAPSVVSSNPKSESFILSLSVIFWA